MYFFPCVVKYYFKIVIPNVILVASYVFKIKSSFLYKKQTMLCLFGSQETDI